MVAREGFQGKIVDIPPAFSDGACPWFDAHRDAGGGDAVHWLCPCACLDWLAQSVLQHEAAGYIGKAGHVLVVGRSVSGWWK